MGRVTQVFSKAEVRWHVIKSQVRSKLISIVRKTEVFRKTWLRLMVINIQVRSKLVIMVRVSDVVRKTDLRLMVIKTQVRLKLVSMAESLKCSTRLQQDERWLRIMWDQSCSLTEILVILQIDTSSELSRVFVSFYLIDALLNTSVTLPIVLALILPTFYLTAASQ